MEYCPRLKAEANIPNWGDIIIYIFTNNVSDCLFCYTSNNANNSTKSHMNNINDK